MHPSPRPDRSALDAPLADEGGLSFEQLCESLIWPKLLRAGGLALRPSRLGIAFFALATLALLDLAPRLWGSDARPVQAASAFLGGLVGRSLAAVTGADVAGLAEVAAEVVRLPRVLLAWENLPATLVVGLPGLAVLAIAGGAICRGAALEFAHGVLTPWPRMLGFAIGRWASLVAALLVPLVLVAVLVLGMAAGGWVLLNWPAVDLLGAALFGFFVLAAFVAVVAMLAYALGAPMLLPAVACEGTDGVDAIQRAYAYVIGRPLRLVLYLIVLTLLGLAVVGLALFVARAAVSTAQESAAWFAGERAGLILSGAPEAAGTARAAAALVRFWTGVALLLASAYGLTYVLCASTLLYLAMRRVCDGQDMHEIWMPGMVEGTMARAMAGRAKAAAEQGLLPAEIRPLADSADEA